MANHESALTDESVDPLLRELAAAPPIVPASRDPAVVEPGTIIGGHYRVVERIGAGGMGIVYRAEDTDLGRDVAVKLPNQKAFATGFSRLQREARAMARLAHPNVLTVFEVGLHGHVPFIAMELVEGVTLRAWLHPETPVQRPWIEIVRCLAAIGRGLAAAHRIGIVHRDFKPDNVLIGTDDRPRVSDFGMARDTELADEPSASGSDPGSGAETQPGMLLGTPAYMSLEQINAGDVTPLSDQFSYCVVCYEALLGFRPFDGRTVHELAAVLERGVPKPPPRNHRLPRALVRVISRGLHTDPLQRHPDMTALVDALDRVVQTHRRRRWIAGSIAAGSTMSVAAFVSARLLAAAPDPCAGAQRGLDGVWDDARRATLHARLGDAEAARNVISALDGYARRWSEERLDACEAARVRAEQSEYVLGLRNACLDRRRGRFDGLLTELTATALEARHFTRIEDLLPPLGDCRDIAALDEFENRLSSRSVRTTTEQDRAANEAETLLAQAVARHRLGREGAVLLAEQAAELARKHGLSRFHRHALVQMAIMGSSKVTPREVLSFVIETGDPHEVADQMLLRAEDAVLDDHVDRAEVHLDYFDAFVERITNARYRERIANKATRIRAKLALAKGEAAHAVELLEPLLEPGRLLADGERMFASTQLAQAYEQIDRPDRAIDLLTQAVTEPERGGQMLVYTLNRLGVLLRRTKRYDEAIASFERAEQVLREAPTIDRKNEATVLDNHARTERLRGQLDRARELQTQALALAERLHGEDSPELTSFLDELARIASASKDHETAIVLLRRSQALRKAAFAPYDRVLKGTHALAEALLDRGRREDRNEARSLAKDLLAAARTANDPKHVKAAEALLAQANARIR